MSEAELYDIAGFKVPEDGEKIIGGAVAPLANDPNKPGGVGTPKLPGDEPPKLNPEKDASTATARAIAATQAGDEGVAATLREMLLPILDSVEAIKKIDDPELQQRAAQALLKNFPHLETVILHNKALANKLLPELTAALVAGLTNNPTIQ